MKFYADAIKFVLVLSLIGRSHNLSIWSVSFFVFVLVLTCIHAIYGTIFNHSLLLIAHSLTCVHTHATVQDITHMHLSLSLCLSLSPPPSLSAAGGFIYTITILQVKHYQVKETILRALDVITIIVPPALPAALTVGTVYALNRLRKQKIYCISPQR